MNLSSSQRWGWVYFRELQYFSTPTSYAVSLALVMYACSLLPRLLVKKQWPGNPLFVHVQPSPEKPGDPVYSANVRIIMYVSISCPYRQTEGT